MNKFDEIALKYFGGSGSSSSATQGAVAPTGPKSLLISDKVLAWSPIVEQEVAKNPNVDAEFVYGVIQAESGGVQEIGSPAGAYGLMQLMRDTAKNLGVDRKNANQNIAGGVKLLSTLLTKYNGDKRKALAAYNGGESGVDKASAQYGEGWLEHLHEFKGTNKLTGENHAEETRRYIQRISSTVNVEGGPVNFDRLAASIYGLPYEEPKEPEPEQLQPEQPAVAQSEVAPKPGMQSGSLDFKSKFAIPFQTADVSTTGTPAPDVTAQENAPSQVLRKQNPESLFQPQVGAPVSGELREQTGGREIPVNDSPIGALVGEGARALTFGDPDALTQERMKDFPVETVAGEVIGTVAPAFLGGAGIQKTLLKVPAMAKLAGAGKWGKTAFHAIARGTAVGTDYVVRNNDALLSDNAEERKRAVSQLATSIVSSVASPLPENFLPKGGMQMLYQSALDMGIQITGDALIGEDSFSPENLVNTISNGVMSALFALNDIKRVPEIGKTKAANADVNTKHQSEGVRYDEDARWKENANEKQADANDGAGQEQEGSIKGQEEIAVQEGASRSSARAPSFTYRLLNKREGQKALPEPQRMIENKLSDEDMVDPDQLANMWNDIESDREILGQSEKLYNLVKKSLFGSLNSKSFGKAFDRNKNRENSRWFAKSGGKDMDRARADFIEENRDALRELGISEESLETESDFAQLLNEVMSGASLTDLKRSIATREKQYFDAAERARAQTPFDSNDDTDWDDWGFTKDEPEPKFSSESEDLFKGTEAEDTRSSGQKEFDQASQTHSEARRARQQEDPFKGTDFDPEEQEAKATKQENLFSGTSAKASVGEYAKREKRPSGIQLPEIVELAKGLMGGKYPKVMNRLSIKNALGLFRPKKGDASIELRADIFKDVEQAEKTLAHEIGHADDFFPEETMSRGNLIGRIASLKKFGKEYLAGFPGGPKPLDDAEKKRLKKIAKQMLSSRFEKEIDEEIVKVTKFTPDDIKAIWNSLDQSKIDPKLYDFIARLSDAEKKSIVLETITTGKIPESVPVKEERIKTGRKITVVSDGGNATPEAIAAKYKDLFEAEIAKRQLLVAKKIRSELIGASNIWKPFDPTKKDAYTKYRLKGEELYADAISILINEPDLLAEKAPMFYRGFFSYMENKPEMLKAYEDIQQRIGRGGDEIYAKRRERLVEGFKGKELQRKTEFEDRLNKQKKESFARGIYRGSLEKFAALEEVVNTLKASGVDIPDSKDPFLMARNKPYVMGKVQAYTEEAKSRIKGSLGWGEKEKEALGLYMLLRRAKGERAEMANPEGIGGKYAEDQLEYEKKIQGIDNWKKIEVAAEEFSKLRDEDIIPILTEDNTFSKELRDKIKNNREYARFSVLKDFVKAYGKDAARSILGIKKQIGTLRTVGNPFIETVVNDVMLVRAKMRNDFIRSAVEMIQKGEGKIPYKAEAAGKRNIRGVKQFTHVENSEMKTVYYLEDGEMKAYNIDREIADVLSTDPVTGNGFLGGLRAVGNLQRKLFIKYSPGFLIRNPVRDIKAFARNIPEANMRQAIKYTLKAFPEVWKYVRTGEMSDDIRNALKEGAMPVERSYAPEKALSADDELDRIMSPFSTEEAKRKFVGRQVDKISNFFDAFGQLEEKTVKMGGFKFVKEKMPDVSPERRAQIIRTRVGTPDVFSGGSAKPILNNIFIFSNANMQGVRSAIEAYNEDKSRFVGKFLLYDVAPKALVIAAEVGALSQLADKLGLLPEETEWLEDAYKAIPEHHKARGDVIPLPFRYEDGRQPYFMIPNDYTGQAIGAIWYRTLKAMAEQDASQISKIAAEMQDVMPLSRAGLLPVIEIAMTWAEYAQGKNPVDAWSNRPVISDKKYGAGLDKELPEMLKWTYDQIGGSIIYKIPNNYDIREKGNLEKVLGLPYAGSIPSAFIKVSDQGVTERQKKEQKKVEKQEKRDRLEVQEKVKDSLKDVDMPTQSTFGEFFREYRKDAADKGEKVDRASVHKTWQSVVAQKYGSNELRKIYNAPTLKQRESLVEQYLDKRNLAGDERRSIRRKLMVKQRILKEMIEQ